MNNDVILQVKNLTKIYQIRKGHPIKAVDNISFKVKRGEILGLLGPNGAGKTTTVKMICSLIRPDKGEILIDGVDNFKQRNKALKKISAVLEGNRNIYWRLTVRENLEFFAALKGNNPKNLKDEFDYYLDLFNLKEKSDVTANRLSRGMQQKLAIAVSLISQSEVILLDEPTLGLDVKTSYEVREILNEIVSNNGRTIILTTHNMNVVQDTCQRVIIINNGKIIVDDEIKNLMRLFEVKSYQFKIQGQLSNEQKNLLLDIPYLRLSEKEEESFISINMDEIDIFYQVVNILEKEHTIIESLEQKEINFEKVFMEILKESEEYASL